MATEPPSIKPLLVSVRDARALLGNLSHNKFWAIAATGEFEILGTRAKRYVTTKSIEAYIARLERAPYSRAGE
jgi:hypothetical protein